MHSPGAWAAKKNMHMAEGARIDQPEGCSFESCLSSDRTRDF